jgi:hypothetical protein
MLKYTNYERYSARLNANFKLFNDKVDLALILNLQSDKKEMLLVGNAPTPGLAITLQPFSLYCCLVIRPLVLGIQIEITHFNAIFE